MGLVALVLVWSAYVAEVYRAGIEAVHRIPSRADALHANLVFIGSIQGLIAAMLGQADEPQCARIRQSCQCSTMQNQGLTKAR